VGEDLLVEKRRLKGDRDVPRRPFGSAVEKLEFAWHAEVEEAMRGLGSSIEVQQVAGLVSSIEV
jgi:hypothetical protein